ncbi:MAG TPA: hypothetical protein VFR37_21425 [Longimicrobium sp.]|nr:hypothetical protein [Longimicrobium sp.]
MELLIWILLLLTMVGATLYAAHHLVHLPYAPECPTCRSVTAQPGHTTRVDRMLARSGVSFRSCPRCGWAGRMRWRLAEERARTGRE